MRKTAAEKAAQATAIADRRRKVAALALARVEQKEIARQLGVSEGTISTDLAALRGEWRAARGDQIDVLQNQDLAALNADEVRWRQKWQTVGETELQLRIYDRVLRIMESRRALLGTNAPTKQEIGGLGGAALVIQIKYDDPDPHAAPPAPGPAADSARGGAL